MILFGTGLCGNENQAIDIKSTCLLPTQQRQCTAWHGEKRRLDRHNPQLLKRTWNAVIKFLILFSKQLILVADESQVVAALRNYTRSSRCDQHLQHTSAWLQVIGKNSNELSFRRPMVLHWLERQERKPRWDNKPNNPGIMDFLCERVVSNGCCCISTFKSKTVCIWHRGKVVTLSLTSNFPTT